jgi:hypothetical protein
LKKRAELQSGWWFAERDTGEDVHVQHPPDRWFDARVCAQRKLSERLGRYVSQDNLAWLWVDL